MAAEWLNSVSTDKILAAGWTPKRVVPLPESNWYFVECVDAWGNETSAIIDSNGEFVKDGSTSNGWKEEETQKSVDRLILI